ncbi:class I SAM-dependent methyltransferase [Actinoplanes sp. TFC3]|uniref:class I SAM-dependent methyltransferase n=1 Tax=Actinoplanes sp. TFC3 TaxID=1710355 RepID=UPI000829EBAB|nr:class I SAM-dependent methyltransferase [Actinoplanes sp. TFC3]
MTSSHHHDHDHTHGAAVPDFFAEMLDLDVAVLHEYHAELLSWLASLAGPVHHILDIGAGTGTGSLGLARRFSEAEVVALDLSAELLARLSDRAAGAGLGERIRVVAADLDAGWPAEPEAFDLAWASASMHHLADPDAVIAGVLGSLRPGGLFAIVELSGFPRFLPARPGAGLSAPAALSPAALEERLHAAVAERHARDLPHLGDDWGSRLAKAGFTVEATRQFDIHLTAPLPAATGRYAQVSLQRLAGGLREQLSSEEIAALHALTGDEILHRDDLEVRASRTTWIGRRP